MLSVLSKLGSKPKTKEQLKLADDEKARKEAIIKQKVLQMTEINQTWSVVLGSEPPKTKDHIKQVKEMTFRNVWMEHNFVYNQIVAMKKDEIFHSAHKYALQWKPPSCSLRVQIPLNDPQALEEAMRALSSVKSKRKQRKILFFFAPINPEIGLYAPRVHPASLVSYRTPTQVLQKLCDFYFSGSLPLTDLNDLMDASYSTWKAALFNILPEDEQVYHQYLAGSNEVKVVKKSLERQYQDDEISLQTYNDLKFPERKKKKDLENMEYPLPVQCVTCVVCAREHCAVIKCMHCGNKACVSCIQRVFLDPDTAEGSFLLLHRRFCTKFGKIPRVNLTVVPEPAYLRELRSTGRLLAVQTRPTDNLAEEENDEMEDVFGARKKIERVESSDDEDEDLFRGPGQATQETNAITPEVLHYKRALDNRSDKMEGLFKKMLVNRAVIDNPRRSEPLRERTSRLNDELLVKSEKLSAVIDTVKLRVEPLGRAVTAYLKESVTRATSIQERTLLLAASATIDEFKAQEEAKEAVIAGGANADLLLAYT